MGNYSIHEKFHVFVRIICWFPCSVKPEYPPWFPQPAFWSSAPSWGPHPRTIRSPSGPAPHFPSWYRGKPGRYKGKWLVSMQQIHNIRSYFSNCKHEGFYQIMEPHTEKPIEVITLYYNIFQQVVIENIESKEGYKNLPKSWNVHYT